MKDAVTTVFVVGTGVLAAATGTLSSLILGCVLAYTVTVVTYTRGRHRMQVVLAEEEMILRRHMAFLDRFLKEDDFTNGSGAWANAADVELLKAYFAKSDPRTGALVPRKPTWDALYGRKQRTEARLNVITAMAKSRISKHTLAAGAAGVSTFLAWPLGIIGLGYQGYREMYPRTCDETQVLARLNRAAADPPPAKVEAPTVVKESVQADDDYSMTGPPSPLRL